MRGIAPLSVIVAIVVILAVFLVAGALFKLNRRPNFIPENQPAGGQQGQREDLGGGYRMNKPFYNKDGVSLTHTWPGEGNFSNEETEVLLFNESSSSLKVKSFDLVYLVEEKSYPHKSGTWEKFPSKESWEKIEYINIDQSHYQGQPLGLARGEKGKLHWHIQFGPNPLDGRQTVRLNLTLVKDGQSINIDQEFKRDSGTVFTKSEH